MNILIYGAGAMGVYFAFRCAGGGDRVVLTAPAGNERLKFLKERGIRVRNVLTGAEEEVPAEVSAGLPPGFEAEAVLVTVGAGHLEEVLNSLSSAGRVMVLGSHFIEKESLAPGLEPGSFLYGFPGTSAAIAEDGTVRYLEHGDDSDEPWGLTIGPWTGGRTGSEKLLFFRDLFEKAGLPARLHDDMRSVIRSQNSVRLPLLAALKLAGGSLDKLADRGDLLKLMVLGTREALGILRKQGSSPEPAALDMYRIIPVFISANMIKRRFSTLASLLGIEEFGNASLKETAYLAGQLLEGAEDADASCEHLMYLFSAFSEEIE